MRRNPDSGVADADHCFPSFANQRERNAATAIRVFRTVGEQV
jgi:hypothetical protein